MSSLPYRQNVEALKREVDELERLTSDERSSMDHILSKADRALGAQRSTVVAAASSVAKRTPLAARQPERRPAPPAAPSAAHHQRSVVGPASSRGYTSSIDAIGKEANERVAMSNLLVAEGWSAAQVRAALFATNGASLESVRGWLQSMPKSHHAAPTNAPPPPSHQAVVVESSSLPSNGVAGSALNAARSQKQQQPSKPLVAGAPHQESPYRQRAVDQESLPSVGSVSSTPVSKIMSREPIRAMPSSHKVQPAISSELSRATPAVGFDAFEAQTMTARGVALSTSVPPAPSSTSAPSVSIQIRDSRGVVRHLGGKLFYEHDSLKLVVMEYFRLYPQTPAPRIGCDVRLVVPWLQRSYSHEELSTVTLSEASLCPTATVVIQVAKHVS
ncbi:Hypothetical protein, putative [Bodo saltans]|uniref:UBX domain-containing protein n=1 Tax=Bodo saltans TaxID=75058 RepID=A0A0S4J5L2_BODSA|nr:Hypothetical protein, putative [Bodo saltans]|eukprot:CUG82963.1 Hypothetical protein, putative [Bodo saltans]